MLFCRRGIINSEENIASEDSIFADDFFQAINEITRDNQCLNFLLQKIIEQKEKPNIKKLENAFEISYKLKSEKEIYIVGRLFENGMNAAYLDDDFFDRIKNIDVFEKVLAIAKDLSDDGHFYVDFVGDICETVGNFGDEFFDKILAANGKMKELKKQPYFEKCIKLGWEGSMLPFIKKNPYFCESLQNLNLEDVQYATGILNKINSMNGRDSVKLDISEFVHFVDLVKRGRQSFRDMELDGNFSERNNLKYSNPLEIILYISHIPDKLPLKEQRGENLEKKEALAEYLNESMSFLKELAGYFEIENILDVSLAEVYEKSANLKLLSSRPEFAKFIKNNFEVKSLKRLSEITGNILKNRIDPKFEFKIVAEKELEGVIKNNSDKNKIENLFFLSKDYEPQFIYWLADLYRKTGFDIFEALSYGYTNSKIPTIKKWYENPSNFSRAVSLGILGGEMDNQKEEYSSNIYGYETISQIFKDEKILQFVLANEDLGFLQKMISSKYGINESDEGRSLLGWCNDQEAFSKAKQLGILKDRNDQNIYHYGAIKYILSNENFLKFALENDDLNILQKSINSDIGVKEDINNKSTLAWSDDPETFSKAKEMGLLTGWRESNLYKYETIEYILKNESFLQFLLVNENLDMLQLAINSHCGGAENEENKSIMGWFNDQETFFKAKQVGIFSGKFSGINNIYRYDKLSCIGKINGEQILQLGKIIDSAIDHNFFIGNLERIIIDSGERALYLSTFKICLEAGLVDVKNIEGLPINKENFCDYLGENEALIEIEKDRGLITEPIPWTKEWFQEDEKRFSYLNKDIVQTFKKFGTNIALAILSGTENSEKLSEFYATSVDRITRESERSTVLQLGEIFSLVISKGNFEMLDQLVDSEVPIGETFKNFVNENEISEKGKTILTLLIAREINTAYYAKTENNIKAILESVYEKLNKYNSVIDLYRKENIPEGLRTSIGMEYEVTTSIAEGYKKRTASDYKKDIEILSCYSGIAKGNDAIHEIATRPTDNPYLVLLEMKLLNDLDFVDLNFEHTFSDTDYERGSRSFHISLGGEYGIKKDAYADFIQNVIVAADLGGINAGKLVSQINRQSNIRAKGNDCDKVFTEKTEVTEFRSLSIDRAEPFERCVVSIFNLNMAKQALDKYTAITPEMIELEFLSDELENIEVFKTFCNSRELVRSEIKDQKIWEMIYNFVKMQKKILSEAKDHNDNFIENETITEDSEEQQDKRQNQKRFSSVIKSYGLEYDSIQKYMGEIRIKPESFYEQINPELVNIFTKIHNLYLKPPTGNLADSVNAKSVFDSTNVVNENGTEYNESDLDAPRRTIFDNLDRGMLTREGRYNIQGSSDKMIINVIQQEIINFNREMKFLLQR